MKRVRNRWYFYLEVKEPGKRRVIHLNNKPFKRLPRKLKKFFPQFKFDKGDEYSAGYWYKNSVRYLDAKLDSVAVWSRSLKDEELMGLWNHGKSQRSMEKKLKIS